MKKIILFICLSIGVNQTFAMQHLKNIAQRTWSRAGVAGLLIGSLFAKQQADQHRNAYPEYSINLMWINKNLQDKQQYVFPSQWRDKSDFDTKNFNTAIQWASLNPNTSVNIWYDSKHLPACAVAKSEAYIQDLAEKEKGIINSHEYSWKTDTNIGLKDIRELPKVKEHPEVFSNQTPVYFRSDLLRPIATLHTLNNTNAHCFVYADLDVKPMSKTELFDKQTRESLKEYGIVMAFTNLGFENSFMMISKDKQNLIKAIDVALIEVNIKRAKNALTGECYNTNGRLDYQNPMRPLEQIVYDSYLPMLKYFYSLEGLGKLQASFFDLKSQTLSKRAYDPLTDGLEEFGLTHRAPGPHLLIEDEQFQKKISPKGWSVLVPTKQVSVPPACLKYE